MIDTETLLKVVFPITLLLKLFFNYTAGVLTWFLNFSFHWQEDEPKALVSELATEIEVTIPVEASESEEASDGGEAGAAKKEVWH